MYINVYIECLSTDRSNPIAANYVSQLGLTASPTESMSSSSTTGTALSLKSSVDSMRFSQELALCDRLSELRQGLTCGQVVSTTSNSSAFNSTTNTTAVAAVAASLLPQSVSHSYTAAALLSSHAYYANSTSTPYLNGPPVMPPSLLYPQLYPSQLGSSVGQAGHTSTTQSSIHLLSNASEVSRNETNTDSNDECSISTDTEQNNESNSDSDRARSRTNNVSVGNGQHRHRQQQQLTTSRSSIFERTVHSAHHSSQQNGISGSATSANTNTNNTNTTTTETLWRPY